MNIYKNKKFHSDLPCTILNPMKTKSLAAKNRHLQAKSAAKMRVRTLASSTAIETRESIATIEAKLTHKRPAQHRVLLA